MPLSFPASSLSHPLPKSPLIITASLLSSPKPRTHRKNHLRPKLPSKSQTLTLTLTEPQSHLDTAHLIPPKQQQQQQQPIEEELINESQTFDPNPNLPTFEFSLRYAALAVVQIFVAAAALLYVGGAREYKLKGISDHDVDAGTGEGVVGKEVGVVRVEDGDEDEKGELDFEMAVLEIREMAKNAREREKKEREKREKESEGILMGGLGEKRGMKKESSKRKKKNAVKKRVSMSKKVEGGGNNG